MEPPPSIPAPPTSARGPENGQGVTIQVPTDDIYDPNAPMGGSASVRALRNAALRRSAGITRADEAVYRAQHTTWKNLLAAMQAKTERIASKSDFRFHLLFILLLLVIVFAQRPITATSSATLALKDALIDEEFPEADAPNLKKSFKDVGSSEEWYSWIRLVGSVLEDSIDQERNLTSLASIYRMNTLIGPVRLRQLRVDPTTESSACAGSLYSLPESCWPELEEGNESTQPYGPGPGDLLGFVPANGTSDESTVSSLNGRTGVYYSGDQRVNFIRDLAASTSGNWSIYVDELDENGWIDEGTRGIFVHANFYNPSLDIWLDLTAIAEVFSGGSINPWWRFRSMRQMYRDSSADQWRLVAELVFVVLLLYYVWGEGQEAYKAGVIVYLKDPWNTLDMVNLTLFGISIYSHIAFVRSYDRFFFGDAPTWPPDVAPNVYVNLDSLFIQADFIYQVLSVNVALSLLKSFKYLQTSTRLSMLWRTLGNAAGELLWFTVVLMMILATFALSGHLLYGVDLIEWRALDVAFSTASRMMLGEMQYEELRLVNRVLTPFFVIAFVALVSLVLVNVFIAIVSDEYTEAKDKAGPASGPAAHKKALKAARKRFHRVAEACIPDPPPPPEDVVEALQDCAPRRKSRPVSVWRVLRRIHALRRFSGPQLASIAATLSFELSRTDIPSPSQDSDDEAEQEEAEVARDRAENAALKRVVATTPGRLARSRWRSAAHKVLGRSKNPTNKKSTHVVIFSDTESDSDIDQRAYGASAANGPLTMRSDAPMNSYLSAAGAPPVSPRGVVGVGGVPGPAMVGVGGRTRAHAGEIMSRTVLARLKAVEDSLNARITSVESKLDRALAILERRSTMVPSPKSVGSGPNFRRISPNSPSSASGTGRSRQRTSRHSHSPAVSRRGSDNPPSVAD